MADNIQGPNFSINWRGSEVAGAARAASATGINQTMAECVGGAKSQVHVITSTLQGGIRIVTFAIPGAQIFGVWGVDAVNYAIWEEIGTQHRPGHPYLRPQIDREYPLMAGRIAAALRG